jgi:hypothetical protein
MVVRTCAYFDVAQICGQEGGAIAMSGKQAITNYIHRDALMSSSDLTSAKVRKQHGSVFTVVLFTVGITMLSCKQVSGWSDVIILLFRITYRLMKAHSYFCA